VTLGRRDFYRHVCLALGLSPSATAAGVIYAINTHVNALGNDQVHPVLLIDEAHLLHQDVLEHLHILANYEWDSKALLSIVLVGLPETRQRLALGKNRSLWSRIHTRLSLGEAKSGDTAEYIAHRLRHWRVRRRDPLARLWAQIRDQGDPRMSSGDPRCECRPSGPNACHSVRAAPAPTSTAMRAACAAPRARSAALAAPRPAMSVAARSTARKVAATTSPLRAAAPDRRPTLGT